MTSVFLGSQIPCRSVPRTVLILEAFVRFSLELKTKRYLAIQWATKLQNGGTFNDLFKIDLRRQDNRFRCQKYPSSYVNVECTSMLTKSYLEMEFTEGMRLH